MLKFPVKHDELIHAVCAHQTRFTDPREYIIDLIEQMQITCRIDEVDIDISHDASSIDVSFDDDDIAWQHAYDQLGVEHEIWTFTIWTTEQECKRLQDVRSARGRRMFCY